MSRLIICTDCGRERPHESKGRCKPCYERARLSDQPPVNRLDGTTRLPIPPMVRCAGCPDVPHCTHVARADVGRCWRCQQEAARAGVAA